MSHVRVKISPFVFERLCTIQESSKGKLFGFVDNVNPTILAFSLTEVKDNSSGEEDKKVSNDIYKYDITPNLPANLNLLGTFTIHSGGHGNNEEVSHSDMNSEQLLLNVDPTTRAVTAKLKNKGHYQKIEHDILDEKFLKDYVHLHLTGKIVMSCNFDFNSVQESLSSILSKIEQGVIFQLGDTKTFILEKGTNSVEISEKATVNDLISAVESNKPENMKMLKFTMYLKNYSESSNSEIAPVIKYVKKSFKCAKINLPIDVLSVVNRKMRASNLYEILLESSRRNLMLNEGCLLKQLKEGDSSTVSIPQIYHFFPRKCGHFLSVAYPKKQMEDQLVGTREIFHKILSLPMDVPIFRKSNVYAFLSDGENPSKVLTNTHEGLSPSGVADGELSLVQGVYGYHHYMQDGFDDNGWGCAYRSLQTIFSWFRHQGFTSRPIPSHREIQQCLVDIGDKPSSFIGSRNWIGSTEVGFVLETLLGVSSRIVSVSSGEEMSMKGGELSHHFRTQGTPVMIGGGVLAHTIIGVDYNKKTGGLKFLILDPHYTGGEDLNVIQSKGWCGWKGRDFWKKNAFYNMCLPLRPKSI